MSYIGEDDEAQVGSPRSTSDFFSQGRWSIHPAWSYFYRRRCCLWYHENHDECWRPWRSVSGQYLPCDRLSGGLWSRQVGVCDNTSAIFQCFLRYSQKTSGLLVFGPSWKKSHNQEAGGWHSPITGRQGQGQGSQGRFGLNGRITCKSTCRIKQTIVVFAHFIVLLFIGCIVYCKNQTTTKYERPYYPQVDLPYQANNAPIVVFAHLIV